MEGEDFHEILQAAEQLTAGLDSFELPRVQRNLKQIIETGRQILERASKETKADSDTKAYVENRRHHILMFENKLFAVSESLMKNPISILELYFLGPKEWTFLNCPKI